jgi:crotonobetainyl-CoA:carnitine CoA-transferase CaiB-like acyl-CoA transferase
MAGPLSHLKVLDLSRVLAGPWSTQFLADMGAEVVKVERPDGGDDTRSWGPPYLRPDLAAYFTCCNRGKKSIAVDFTTPEGAALVRRLVLDADILVENFKRGGLEKYGLDYASLKALKPDLIYCSITGFGQTGPYADRAGYDLIIQAMGGLMSVTGNPDGVPGGGPIKSGVAVADLFTGMYAVAGILAAIVHRDRTGEGQQIDVALLDVQVAMLGNLATNYFATGKVPQRWGNAHPNLCPYQSFAVADGHLIVGCGNDGQFQRLCEAAGMPELARDPRFAGTRQRVENRPVLIPILEQVMLTQPRVWWIERLEAAGVPCGPINTIDEVFADPQVVARGLRNDMTLADGTPVATVANPLRFSATHLGPWAPPPLLDQQGEEIRQRADR